MSNEEPAAPSDAEFRSREATIRNRQGMHARPVGKLVQLTQTFQSEIFITFEGNRVDAKSVINLVLLGAPCGSVLRIEARGPDSEQALEQIATLIDNYFGMPATD